MNTINLINLKNNTKKNIWIANFQSDNGFKITDVKITSEKAMDFIINAGETINPVLDQNDKNIIIYNFI